MEGTRTPQRRSPRLRGFDYAEPGAYFITVCAANRACIFGLVEDGRMVLSQTGEIVDECWREIPLHFQHVRATVCQVMPNHVHGFIEILGRVGTRHAVSLHPSHGEVFGRPKRGSLSTIIGAFKSAASKKSRSAGILHSGPLWQRRFYDRIIRDDTERFFIEQYIALNPLLWFLDSNNPDGQTLSDDEMRRILRAKSGLDEYAVERLLEQRMV